MSELPENLKLDLDRAVEGEPIIWAGVQQTRTQVYAVCILAGALAGFFAWIGLQLAGVIPHSSRVQEAISGIDGPDNGWLLFGGAFLFAAVMVILQTRRFTDLAGRVIWAVTPSRLVRRIPGLTEIAPLMWPRGSLRSVTVHDQPKGAKRIEISVTPLKEGGGAKKLFISGPENLADAEAPLRALIGEPSPLAQ